MGKLGKSFGGVLKLGEIRENRIIIIAGKKEEITNLTYKRTHSTNPEYKIQSDKCRDQLLLLIYHTGCFLARNAGR